MKKILVVGLSGSGKTTFSKKIAHKLKLPHVQLDDFYWSENWQPTDKKIFAQIIKEIDQKYDKGWVMDGNYHDETDEYQWNRADTIIHIDLNLAKVLWRIISRTLRRVVFKIPAAGGNLETLKGGIFSKDSLLMYNVKQPDRVKSRVQKQKTKALPNQNFYRFKSNRSANKWLKSL